MASVGPALMFNEQGEPMVGKATVGEPLVFNEDGTLYVESTPSISSQPSSAVVASVASVVAVLVLAMAGFVVYTYRKRTAMRSRLRLSQKRQGDMQQTQPYSVDLSSAWETASEMMIKLKNETSHISTESMMNNAKRMAQEVKEGVPVLMENIQKRLPKIPFQGKSEYDDLNTFNELTDEEDEDGSESDDLVNKKQRNPDTMDLEAYLPTRLSRSSSSRHTASSESSVSDHHQIWREQASSDGASEPVSPAESTDATLWATPLPLLSEMAKQDDKHTVVEP